MAKVTEAEQYLLDGIRGGDGRAWSQLVDRYQGRLLRFAHARLPRRADCEDIIQDVFVAFISGLPRYHHDCNLETYLFSLLRRKIIDVYRRRAASHVCLLQDRCEADVEGLTDPMEARASSEPSASWHARRDEHRNLLRQLLAEALTGMVARFRQGLDFDALKTVELLFYCHLSNSDVAKTLGASANRVGVFKHRCLKQIQEAVAQSAVLAEENTSIGLDDLLTEVWQSLRLSCPKRSTVGGYVLGTLDKDWHGYVDFHLHTLGCHFCRANLDDLMQQTAEQVPPALHSRIMESTVGFMKKD